MFQFLCRFAFFVNFSSLRPDTENNANFDAVIKQMRQIWESDAIR